MKRVFRTLHFSRWMRKTELSDPALYAAVVEMERGLIDGESYRRFAMTTKGKAASRILEAVHETARGLDKAGFIDKRRMREYDVLCLEPVPDYSSKKIRALRERYKLSQAVLASVLNTSLSTIRQWEIGEKHPSGPSLKLLNLLDRKGLETLI